MSRSLDRQRNPLGIALLAFGVWQATACASAEDFVERALAHEVMGRKQTQIEAADYADARIPKMPDVKTLAEWEAYVSRTRSTVLDQVVFRGKAAEWRVAPTKVEWLETIDGGPGYKIRKVRYEAIPGLWIPALLYAPDGLDAKAEMTTAAVLNVNGHDAEGKAADFKQIRCINQAKRGMIALHIEWFGMGQLKSEGFRHDLINHVDLTGTSGIALHYLALTKGLDLLLSIKQTDPKRVAVTGLSGGGWQTIFVGAFDTRATLINPVAGYSSDRTRVRILPDLGDSEQTPADLAKTTDYAIMTAMLAPRPTLLTYNANDNCCYAAPTALPPLVEAAEPIFKLFGKGENLRTHINHEPGTHNYLLDNRQAHYQMLGDHFFAGVAGFDPREIDCAGEIKSPEMLETAMPADNADFRSIALDLAKSLPVEAEVPAEAQEASKWRETKRLKLREVLRVKEFEASAASKVEESGEGINAIYWRLNVGGWSVPVVELSMGEPKATWLILADEERKDLAATVRARLGKGGRVLIVEPFYVGEGRPAEKDYLWALMLSTVGDRPLGLQASEVAAVARWADAARGFGPVHLETQGKRASVIGLVAAAFEVKSIASVEAIEALQSLKDLIEASALYNNSPELFDFGLLHDFDVAQLAALAAPRSIKITPAP